MRKAQIRLLSAEQDRETLAPVLERLRAQGVRVSEAETGGRDEVTLAVLSEAFYADGALTDALLSRLSAGAENVLPLKLDAAPVPPQLKKALYARNIIPAEERSPEQLAERIRSAIPEKKSRLPLLLTAGALVLAVVAGLLIWQAVRSRPAVPAMADVPAAAEIVLPAGLTEADLALVEDVVIVGDRIEFYTADDVKMIDAVTNGNAVRIPNWPQAEYFAYRSWEDDTAHFYSREDGHEYSLTRYEDLRFLALMPNLMFLSMSLVEAPAEALPELGGLSHLIDVNLWDCDIPDLAWLTGSSTRSITVLNSTGSVRDFRPLTSCGELEYAHLDLVHTREADLSGFAPPKLRSLWINNGRDLQNGLDLSGLLSCRKLQECRLEYGLPLEDLSFLANARDLEYLKVENLHQLRDISVLRGLSQIRELEIRYCGRVTDYSPVGGCTALRQVHFQCDDNPSALRDASFLADLPVLQDIGIYAANLHDLDFLEGIADNAPEIRFGFAGIIEDYSGLAHIKRFDYLHVNPRNHDYTAVEPWIRDAQVKDLMLYDCNAVDLGTLPEGVENLSIRYGDITDLTGLRPYRLQRLELWGCQRLSSLAGLETVPTRTGGELELEIVDCPRLTDFSALDGADLELVKMAGAYALPDFSRFRLNSLRLESIPELTDLRVLDGLAPDRRIDLALVGLDQLRDLTPLQRLKGRQLMVPPQVAEQAEELVQKGVFERWEPAYPDGSWQPDDSPVTLLSLEELNTLPKALLRRVERLCLVGDALVDLDSCDIREDWQDGRDMPVLLRHNWNTDESAPIEYGEGVVTDLSMFSELTGLRELQLYAQPLKSLDGVQNLSALDSLSVRWCPALADISAAFASPQIRYLTADNCPVESIQGVQNLGELRGLNINGTRVKDLSPLAALDYTAAVQRSDGDKRGFELWINDIPAEDYSPLSAIPVLEKLEANNAEAPALVPALEGVELRRFAACGAFTNRNGAEADALLAAFVAAHPSLIELAIPWNPDLTDLTPLLALEDLEYVRVSFDMEKAVESLAGREYGFELAIEGG